MDGRFIYKKLHVYNLQRIELRFLKLHDRHAFANLTVLVREVGEEVATLISVRRLIGCSISLSMSFVHSRWFYDGHLSSSSHWIPFESVTLVSRRINDRNIVQAL